MMQLPTELGANGLYMRQVSRNETAALYSVHLTKADATTSGYEVWIIKTAKPSEVFGKSYPEREVPPSNEDFGKCAWSWKTLETAQRQFDSISESGRAK